MLGWMVAIEQNQPLIPTQKPGKRSCSRRGAGRSRRLPSGHHARWVLRQGALSLRSQLLHGHQRIDTHTHTHTHTQRTQLIAVSRTYKEDIDKREREKERRAEREKETAAPIAVASWVSVAPGSVETVLRNESCSLPPSRLPFSGADGREGDGVGLASSAPSSQHSASKSVSVTLAASRARPPRLPAAAPPFADACPSPAVAPAPTAITQRSRAPNRVRTQGRRQSSVGGSQAGSEDGHVRGGTRLRAVQTGYSGSSA